MTGFQVETMKSGNSIPCECMANQRSELPYELPLASLLQIVSENVRNCCKNGRIGRWPNAACLEFLAAACVSLSFHERGLALFLVFPYLAKKTPLE